MPSAEEWSHVFRRACKPQFVGAAITLGLSRLWQSPDGRLFAVGRGGLRATSASELVEGLPRELRSVEGLADAMRQLLREAEPEPPPIDAAAIGAWRRLAQSGDLGDRTWGQNVPILLSPSDFGEVCSGCAPDRSSDRLVAVGAACIGLRLVPHPEGPPSVWLPPRKVARRRLEGNQWAGADVDYLDISET